MNHVPYLFINHCKYNHIYGADYCLLLGIISVEFSEILVVKNAFKLYKALDGRQPASVREDNLCCIHSWRRHKRVVGTPPG